MTFEELKNKMLQDDEELREEYYYRNHRNLKRVLANLIIEGRISTGMTVKDLADKTNLSETQLNKFEDEEDRPTLEELQMIAEAFDTYLLPPDFASLRKERGIPDYWEVEDK